MDIVLLFNGLGNQMSQYAFYLAKKHYNPQSMALYYTYFFNGHNGYELGRVFNIHCDKGLKHNIFQFLYRLRESPKIGFLKGLLTKMGVRKICEAQNYDFNYDLLTQNKGGINFFWGGWHSEKNFIDIKEEIKAKFTFPKIYDEDCLRVINQIKNVKESVSLHIRRGDYLTAKPNDFYQFGNVATMDYYKKAISRLISELGDCTFFVFSDDLKWCKEEFTDLNAVYVDCNQGKNSWRDMYLMTLCKNHINANSSFSWWGAWLSTQEGITICPKEFIHNVVTKDIYPDSWIKM